MKHLLLQKSISVLLSGITILSLTSCSSSNTTPSTVSEQASSIISSKLETSEKSSYPITITDHLNRTIVINKEPSTIISGYYTTSSILLSLGLEDKFVGIEDKASSRPLYKQCAEKIIDLPNVGSAKKFDLEGCISLNPDIVILPIKLINSIPELESLGITVIAVNPEDDTLLFETLDIIGKATNTSELATRLKSHINDKNTELNNNLKNETKPSVYLSGNGSLLETAGSEMYQNSLIKNSGGVNSAEKITDTYWSTIDYEQLLNWNPDYIFIAANATYDVDSVLSDKNISECTAVKNKNVYKIPNSIEPLDYPLPAGYLASYFMASKIHSNIITEDNYNTELSEFYKTFYNFTPDEKK